MAFLRVEKKKSGTYLRIVQAYKQDGKPKHRTLYSLGKVEDYPQDQLERIGKKFLELAGKSFEEIVTYQLKEEARFNYGYPLVVNKLWERYALSSFFKKSVLRTRKVRFSVENLIKLLICDRLCEPVSKLASFQRQHDYIGLEEVQLQHIYRTLDLLDDLSGALQTHLFKRQRSLFSQKLDIVFYDVTTLYFDAHEPAGQDDIRQKGYSKDGKAHKLQVVLGLLVDQMRNPVAYQLYEGNQYEGHTFTDSIHRLKKTYRIDQVIMVCDRGMMNSGSLKALQESGYDYIIGERLKNLPAKVKTQLIDKDQHHSLSPDSSEPYSYRQLTVEGKRIIATYSAKRARKDAHERQKLVEKAQAFVDDPSKLKQRDKKGARRFLNYEHGKDLSLDENKIKEAAKYDGFLAISTNRQDLPVAQVIEQYTNLFEVEHAFRTLKSVLEIRPVFHWNPKRIRGHVALCFLAYLFLNDLQKTTGWSPAKLNRVLDKMQLSKVSQADLEPFYLRSHIDPDTQHLIDKLKLVVPKDTTPQTLVNQHFS